MTITELFEYLHSLDIQLWVDGDRLRLNAPKGVLTPQLNAQLTERKAELIAFLRRAQTTGAETPSLQPMPRDQHAPLSFSQQRLWFLDQMEPGNTAYNLSIALQLRGPLDAHALEQSAAEVLRRHSVLCTTIVESNGQPLQRALSVESPLLPVIDLRPLALHERQAEAERLIKQVATTPFDLEQGPLFRMALMRTEDETHQLIFTVHHIVADGISLAIFVRELGALYDAYSHGQSGQSSPLPEPPIQYADYAYWQRQWLQGSLWNRQLAYWKQQLAGSLPILEVIPDHPRPAVQTFHGAKLPLTIPPHLATAVKALSRRESVTVFILLLAAFKALLHRYTGQTDIIVGTPIAGRNRVETEELIGCFINSLALRTDLTGDPTFRDLIGRVRSVASGGYAHQDIPFEALVGELHPVRDVSRSPIFQVMFLQNSSSSPFQFGDLDLDVSLLDNGASMVDITIYIQESYAGLTALLEYNTDLYTPATMRRLLEHYQALLEGAVANPDQPISTIPLLSEPERRQVLVAWNDTEAEVPSDRCLHHLFEAQVMRTPEAVAVEFEGNRLTYRELDERANRTAHHLQQLGVQPGTLVGIALERSLAMMVGLLGILKAGAAYVPLDPAFPKERLAFMLADSQVQVVLTQASLRSQFQDSTGHLVCLDEDWDTIAACTPEPPDGQATPDGLAYVIYTSGSTGRPKGVQLTHRSVVNFLCSMQKRPGLTPDDTLLAVTTLSFDIAVLELFLPLVTGAKVVIVSREVAADGLRLAAALDTARATVMQATPVTWRLLLASGGQGDKTLKALCGGEALPRDLADQLLERYGSVWNLYGPTETTVWSTVHEVTPGTGAVSIGRPIANTQVYILDASLQPVPIGVVGDLYIGGHGLAAGYLNRDELTAERFVPNPFTPSGRSLAAAGLPPNQQASRLRNQPEAFLYKTGDLARYLADGTIEFLGRSDFQVKLRGLRIELGEIESLLDPHPAVQQAVVTLREDRPGDKRLVAYLVVDQAHPPAQEELRHSLRDQLPDYMVPSHFVMLEQLPLTPNNKVDRGALPPPDTERPQLETGYVPPRSELEDRIAAIWREVLNVDKVGIHDNFFDLGGHSLLLTQVHTRLRPYSRSDLSIIKLFQFPTISALAAHLAENGTAPVAHPGGLRVLPANGEAVQGEPIAVIGLAGRFPGARNIEELWQNLCNGVEGVTFFTEEELRAEGIHAALLNDPNYVRARAVLQDVEYFDAAFFGVNPQEAELTDPQHRLFLECAWAALEHAGYDPDRYPGAIGVYAGSSMNTYLLANLVGNLDGLDAAGGYQLFIGNDKDFLPTRVSYKLNLRGPSVSIQTACSTSLVAVHHACRSLWAGECDMALAGGVSVTFPHHAGYLYQEGMILSPDGHCRAFDADAKGTVAGEGVGLVVLKRLSAALAAGDTVWAVIKGSAINNDGANKVGYTAPSVAGQAEVIAQAQAMAGVEPQSIGYVEAHGTATPLGDPVEVAALTQVFGAHTEKPGFCALGSIKSNIGHLDAAAGVAGLIKTVLALHHRQIPPSLHFTRPNPEIDLDHSPFYVNTTVRDWQADSGPRRAGVSSFGIGGTNAHIVLEEAPVPESAPSRQDAQLLAISARTASALEAATDNLLEHLQANPDLALADVAYTLQVGRRGFDERRILVCTGGEDAITALQGRDPRRVLSARRPPHTPNVVFMFPGQGAQYVGMAHDLYESEPVFRQTVDQCAELLQPHLGLDLRMALFADETALDAAEDRLRQTRLAQPALFVVEYALAQLWMAWGVRPHTLIGHSIGEYVAACLAGVFTLEEALRLVAVRGRLMQELPPGEMLAVALPEHELRAYLNGADVALASVNAPALCVVSGPVEAIEAVRLQLAEREVTCRRLHTSHAFHSPMMTPVCEPFAAELARTHPQSPHIPFVSNVSGTWITATEATDRDYWLRHALQPVRFSAGLEVLLQSEPRPILLEVGPGNTLSQLARQQPVKPSLHGVLASLRHPREQIADGARILTTLGQLWLSGVEVDWPALHTGDQRQRVPLPTYPFERRKYWVQPNLQAQGQAHKQQDAGKKPDPADWFYVPSWERDPAPKLPAQRPLFAEPLTWLVFRDRAGIGAALISRLEALGHQVIGVEIGREFRQVAPTGYVLNPQDPDGYAELLQELVSQGKTPDRIVHLWSVTPDRRIASLPQWNEDAQTEGFYSLLSLVQAISRQEITKQMALHVLSTGLHDVHGDEALEPAKGTLLGICRVIPQEYPNIRCCSVDLSLPTARAAAISETVDQLLVELATVSTEPIVAYRQGYRWVQSFKPVRLPSPEPSSLPLRQHGVYLITGGLGAISYSLATFLASTVSAKLVLTGRSVLPPRAGWTSWLESHPDNDPMSARIRNILALEELGAEVMLVTADVADAGQMREVIAQAVARFGALHGVVHAAGTVSMAMLSTLERSECEQQFQAKGQGLVVLANVLQGIPLDFCLATSSLSTVLGGLGYAAYAGANAYMDAFVRWYNRTHHAAWQVVDWDAWHAGEPNPAATAQAGGLAALAMTPTEGVDTFVRLLAMAPDCHIVVSTGDLEARLDQWVRVGERAQDETATRAGEALDAIRTQGQEYVAPRSAQEKALATIWQELLGIQQVGIHDNFFDLGGSSLVAVRLFDRIERKFGQKLPLAVLFHAPTIADMAALLEDAEPQETPSGPERSRAKSGISWSSLVPIQPNGNRLPLYCVHAAGGNVLLFRELAQHLGPAQPVYGLQAQGLDGKQPILEHVEEMAELYVRSIKAVQPHGPYMLAGYCMGGTVALEMAQQLRAQGDAVAFLALFETYNWHHMKLDTTPAVARFFLQKLEFHLRNFQLLSNEGKKVFLIEKLKVAKSRQRVWSGRIRSLAGRIEGRAAIDDLILAQVWDTNDRASLLYRPQPYPGKITHFRPIKEYSCHTGPELGWERLAQEVETRRVRAYPAGMLVEPFVADLAATVEECIEQALRRQVAVDDRDGDVGMDAGAQPPTNGLHPEEQASDMDIPAEDMQKI